MHEDARAFWITSPGHGEIRREAVPAPAEGDVVIRTMYTAISRGTEALVFQGRVPVSEYGRMRAPFQAGDFPGPLKYGYANVGCVEHGPPDLVNQHVFVLFPHQTRYTVPSDSVFVLPEGVPPHRAVLAANLETAINGLWDARPQIGDRVAVVGGGTVGCLVAWLAGRIPGCEVELVDINPQRAVIAQALGVRFARPEAASDGADLVIHASGSPAGLQLALSLAAFEATIAELSWYGDQPVTVALGQAFHARRLTLKSSQVGTVAPSQRARWNPRRRMQLALAALTEPALDVLITGENEFDQLPQVMADLSRQPGNTLCHRIRYGQYIG
jgi:threonine dehydrogenase-like Zn-dependent dehydrogenase